MIGIKSTARKAACAVLLLVPLLGACSEQERSAADIRQKAHELEMRELYLQHRLEVENREIEARRKVAVHATDLAAETARQRDAKVANVAKVLGLFALGAAVVVVLAYWIRQVVMQRTAEAHTTRRTEAEWEAKVKVVGEITCLLSNPNSGLPMDVREELLGRTITAANHLQITYDQR